LHASLVWRRDSEIAQVQVQAAELRVLQSESESDRHETTTAVVRQEHAWEERWGETERKRERECVRE
jgi:hypothetical protein